MASRVRRKVPVAGPRAGFGTGFLSLGPRPLQSPLVLLSSCSHPVACTISCPEKPEPQGPCGLLGPDFPLLLCSTARCLLLRRCAGPDQRLRSSRSVPSSDSGTHALPTPPCSGSCCLAALLLPRRLPDHPCDPMHGARSVGPCFSSADRVAGGALCAAALLVPPRHATTCCRCACAQSETHGEQFLRALSEVAL